MKVILGPIPCQSCHAFVTLRRPPKRRAIEGPAPSLTWMNPDWTRHDCAPRQTAVGL